MFKKGQSGNLSGRPKGSKNKLTEALWHDFADAWHTHGARALETVAKDEPGTFVKVAASVMPKDLHVTTSIEDMTDEERLSRIRELSQQLAIGVAGATRVSGGSRPKDKGQSKLN